MDRSATPATLPRFALAERLVHWTNALVVGVLIVTGYVLYGGPGAQGIGYRTTFKTIHVWTGLAMPAPILVGIALSAPLRDDLLRLSRWTRDDRRWWSRARRGEVRLAKFNPGQKLNTSFTGAALVVLLMTGSIMKWYKPFADSYRTGATFVHDWTALALGLAIAGHVLLAFRDPDALHAMRRGRVDAGWAARERPRWHAEMTAPPAPPASPDPAEIHPEPVAEHR